MPDKTDHSEPHMERDILRHTTPPRLKFYGVLAAIAGNLAESGFSIESMVQRGRAPVEPVAIVMITHDTAQACVEHALKAIGAVWMPCAIWCVPLINAASVL